MATIRIIINQIGKPAGVAGESRDDLDTGALVVLTNDDNDGATSFLWEFVSTPATSAATLFGATTSTASFTPDVIGSYLFQLTINGRIKGRAIAAVKTGEGLRIPATGEANELGGWEVALGDNLGILEIRSLNVDNIRSQIIEPAAATPAAGDLLFYNGATWEVSEFTGGDLDGSYPDPTVIGLNGTEIGALTSVTGDALSWSGTQWVNSDSSLMNTFGFRIPQTRLIPVPMSTGMPTWINFPVPDWVFNWSPFPVPFTEAVWNPITGSGGNEALIFEVEVPQYSTVTNVFVEWTSGLFGTPPNEMTMWVERISIPAVHVGPGVHVVGSMSSVAPSISVSGPARVVDVFVCDTNNTNFDLDGTETGVSEYLRITILPHPGVVAGPVTTEIIHSLFVAVETRSINRYFGQPLP